MPHLIMLGQRQKSVTIVIILSAAAIISGCHSRNHVPARDSKAYPETVSAFYVGLAALQVGDDVRADTSLSQTTKLAPGEPSGWADWGILALRQRNFEAAAQRFETARRLAPKDDRIYYLAGLLESDRDNSAQAIADLRQAAVLNPRNVRAIYQLALEIERQGDANSQVQFKELIQTILKQHPDNLAALLELGRISAKQGDASTLNTAISAIAAQSSSWPPEVLQQLAALKAAASSDPRSAATRTTFLRNVLMRVPSFRQSMNMLKPDAGDEAQPFLRFVRMESPSATPSPADMALTFRSEPIPNPEQRAWDWIGAIWLSGDGNPVVATADARQVRLSTGATFAYPGGASNTPPTPEGVLPVDFNYDFKTDFVLAGASGLRLMQQDSPTAFTDVTAASKLPPAVVNGSYTGAWAVDIEADGDMDVVLGSKSGLPLVLRNNGDSTFATMRPFNGVSGLSQFVWADFNGDGNPDAALLDSSGNVHLFLNERSGQFREVNLPVDRFGTKAIAAADVSGNGVLDLLCVKDDGRIVSYSWSGSGASWSASTIATAPQQDDTLHGEVRLHIADLDNNGALDLMLSGADAGATAAPSLIWLGDQDGHFRPLQLNTGATKIFSIADVNNDGKLDLLGISPEGAPMQLINASASGYHWQVLRPRAKQASGDQRINSFGIGGEIEIRSGLLVQKQSITGPVLHFGLGTHTGADVARIVWPNGSARAEFALKADQSIVTEQRLKGSCPFLFAFNGTRMQFVKDAVPWGSAIGLRIDALGSARINATEEWYKIGRDQLVAHNGFYDLRITGELWETYYYDYLSLMTVDHPAGTEIFTDERFTVPAAKLAIVTVATPHPITRATDDMGHDVTALVQQLDGKYIDSFGRGQYQGITRDHYVEFDLGQDVPLTGPLWLIAQGWLHPSDSSINVAISQGKQERPRGLSLEVPDGHGGWKVARDNLGFPAGRNKTCLIDLTDVFVAGTPRRIRLRTNLEIYWDKIDWATGLPDAPTTIHRLLPAKADLHYRGYSMINQVNASSPELPDYNHLAATTQIWQDLYGYYTRYGDVRDLLKTIDDRYVIMNAGDEISLLFPERPSPKPGWVRDYVIAGDGWIKDGDYNTVCSKSVLPLPHHDRTSYDTAPGELEQEWVYQRHAVDWQQYHTRYITPDSFRGALRPEVHIE